MLKKILWYVCLPVLVAYQLLAVAFGRRPPTLPAAAPAPTPPPPELPLLEEGDVVNTPLGPVRVIGVDASGVAWCQHITRAQSDFKMGLHQLMAMDARAGAQYRVEGVKHSWMEVPS